MAYDIVTRSEWGSKYGVGGSILSGPLDEVIVHTSDGRFLSLVLSNEILHWKAIERYHVENNGWSAIGYSWGFMPSGRIFEGRGWLRSGAHTEGRNYVAHGFCVVGDGDLDAATPEQWASMRYMIGVGIQKGAIRSNPNISGHRDYSTKRCPGDKIYPYIGRLRGISGPVQEEDDMFSEADRATLKAIDARTSQLVVFGTRSVDETIESLFGHLRRTESNTAKLLSEGAALEQSVIDMKSAVIGAVAVMDPSMWTDDKMQQFADKVGSRINTDPAVVLNALKMRLES